MRRPVAGRTFAITARASAWWSPRVDSASVIALASTRRSPARTPAHRRSHSCGSGSGDACAARLAGATQILTATVARGADLREHIGRACRDGGARAVDARHAGRVQHRVILLRHHAADEHDDVARALLAQRVDDRRHQRLVAGRQRRDADRVHVVLDRLPRGFLRRLEQRADVDVEAEIRKGGRHDLGAAIVAVLAELGHHDPRPAAFLLGERLDVGLDASPTCCPPRIARRRRRTRFASSRDGGPIPSPARRKSRRPWRGRARRGSRGRAGCPRPCARPP